ncbi:MAG: phosphatidylglycerol lysyltransferase domain-containing protein [Proteobacteria bacterium]|nr:phosphatidylglycerol lysyltransferase domain-containing protein [Pseudomonadota bacterium]
MSKIPEFPDFKPIDLQDRDIFKNILKQCQPRVSEWTFTNLFIWRSLYRFQWSCYKDWLMIICRDSNDSFYAMEPMGPASRREAAFVLLEWLSKEKNASDPRIERADELLASELNGLKHLIIEPAREHFDYVYLRDDLVALAGNKYRSKRNHINQLFRSYNFEYEALDQHHIDECLKLQEKWCLLKRCEEDLNLSSEWEAVREVLHNYSALELKGGVVMVEKKVMAFTIGELLNDETAVVHIEKADPDIPGLYQIVNQQFCEKAWENVPYINREQDLGLQGLREAKLSYYPHHFVEKYMIRLIR